MYADWQMAEKVDQKDVLEEHVVEVLAKRGWTVTHSGVMYRRSDRRHIGKCFRGIRSLE